jgi:hypothetical protein
MTTHPNLSTGLFVCAIFAAFFAAQTLDMTDHSAEHAQADEMQAAMTDAEKQRRKDVAAQYACGPQSAYEWEGPTTIRCYTTRGRKAGQVEVAAK